ncbi:MAG TPA: phosphonate metabolism protein/1,5-bisphosphokinase (PRPP-forming) PhnN [Bradyrhizobium sp.]
MTDSRTITTGGPARIGPGRLVLVVGPSGAGKDTLLNLARAACAGDRTIVFPRRIVTREASPSEDNRQIDPESFQAALARSEFAVHWEAHGHSYALPRGIDDDIRAGRIVVANVSRTVLQAMRRAYADVVVVEISAPPEVLAERLAMRARGSDGAIEDRLRRNIDEATVAPDVTILNVGDARPHARELLAAIKGNPKNGAHGREDQDHVDHCDDRTA